MQRVRFLFLPEHAVTQAERTKRCSRCAQVKPWSAFVMRGRNARGNSRPTAFCKACGVERVQKWKANYPDRYEALVFRSLQQRRALRAELLGREPRNCDICGTHFVGEHHDSAHYDHNHDSGAPRGWLCNKCNVGIGALGDNPVIVLAAHTYLVARGHAPTRPRFS